MYLSTINYSTPFLICKKTILTQIYIDGNGKADYIYVGPTDSAVNVWLNACVQ